MNFTPNSGFCVFDQELTEDRNELLAPLFAQNLTVWGLDPVHGNGSGNLVFVHEHFVEGATAIGQFPVDKEFDNDETLEFFF
jgi:hypothetical protein